MAVTVISSILLVGVFHFAAAASDVVIKPTISGPTHIALVMIQGAEIPADKYTPLAKAIQGSSDLPIWVGIPEFSLSTPEPLVIKSGINRIISSMQSQGMPETAKLFFTGHSLGGIILQDYLNGSSVGALGQVLMGSFLQRKYRNSTYTVPTMTIGGELDGLCRVTRIMEEYYHRLLHAPNPSEAIGTFPVAILLGCSHIQFASGPPPELVKLRDLQPEVTIEEAHQVIAKLVNAFISVRLGNGSELKYLEAVVADTASFCRPLIAAYELEGSYEFLPPCYKGLKGKCTLGSKWSEHAQQVMGALPMGTVNDVDVFHPVYQINPVHLPHVLNTTNCAAPSKSCVVNMTTVSQNVYETIDNLVDAGFVYTSASEMRVKLKSRQIVLQSGGYKNVDFNKTDDSSICKDINQEAYNWAVKNSNPQTVARFNKYGTPMVMGEDKGPYNVGPVWIWDPLSFDKSNSSGQEQVVVRSVTMRTPSDYKIKAAAGMHYCKLLSPARVMEWVYLDSLREKRGINN